LLSKKRYLIQPYQVGKAKKSLAMILPSEVIKTIKFDPLTMLLFLKVDGMDEIHLKVIREEDLIKKENIPAEKFPRLDQQVSEI